MQISNVLPKLSARWSSNWKTRQLSRRLGNLALGFLGYLIMTILMMGVTAGIIINLVASRLQYPAIQFLAIVFLCLLGIITAHSFDADEDRFVQNKIYDEAERIETNTASPEIYELRKAVEELTDRVGHS
jgi:glucan phosphoethanolaminetransferase (alkaline phosphatase superfamily)